jgi:hypothetical protein
MEKAALKKLEDLFEFASPASIRKSLNQVFFNYLVNNHHSLPLNFDRISEDFYYLMDFLEEVEEGANVQTTKQSIHSTK